MLLLHSPLPRLGLGWSGRLRWGWYGGAGLLSSGGGSLSKALLGVCS